MNEGKKTQKALRFTGASRAPAEREAHKTKVAALQSHRTIHASAHPPRLRIMGRRHLTKPPPFWCLFKEGKKI